MRKTKLLLALFALIVGGNSLWAQASYNHTYTVGAEVSAGGDFFLYNIGQGQFLTSGLNYGTRATVDNSGRVLTLTVNGSGYNIYTNFVSLNNRGENTRKAGYLTTNGYVDTGSSDAAWVFTPVEVPGYTNAYTIKNSDTQFLFFDAVNTDPGCPVNVGSNTGNNYSYWLLIPRATREEAGDYTHYLINTQMNAAWEYKTWGGSTVWDDNAIVAPGGKVSNRCGEKYHAVVDIYQSISETVPNGKYRLYVQGFYRQDDGKTQDAPDLYANSNTNSIGVLTGTENSMDDASDSFTAGKYANNSVETVVTNGSLRVGINITGGNQWVIFDNFVLDYVDPFISVIATEIPAATATTLTADKWYKFIAASNDNYTFATTTISDIDYTTTDQLLSEATGSVATATMALTEGTTYYLKSTSTQSLTITPQTFTYTVGDATPSVADTKYTQSKTFTLTFESANTDDPDATFHILDASKITVNSSIASASVTDNVLTITLADALTVSTDYVISVAAGAVGYKAGEANSAISITVKTPNLFDGIFYMATTDGTKFVSRGGDSSTESVLDKYGLPVSITTDTNNKSLVKFLEGDYYLYAGSKSVYSDKSYSAGGDNIKWTIASYSGGYSFYTGRDRSEETNKGNYIAAGTGVESGKEAATFAESAYAWTLKTKAERDAIVNTYPNANKSNVIADAGISTTAAEFESWLATNRAAKDKTSEVGTAKFAGDHGDWTWTRASGAEGDATYGTDWTEAFQTSGTWTQTIEDLPAGIYKVTVNGFERKVGYAVCNTLGAEGYEPVIAYFKANDEQLPLKSWYSDKTGTNNPNNTSQAATAFNNDKYKNTLYTYVEDSGDGTGSLTLTIGKQDKVGGSWLLFNNVTLTYYDTAVSDEDATAILAEATTEMAKPMKASLYQALATAKSTFDGSKTVPNYNALRTAIDNTATSIASYAAMKTNYLDKIAELLATTNVYSTTSDAYIEYAGYKDAYDNYKIGGTADVENATANALSYKKAGSGGTARYTESTGTALLVPGWKINGNDATTTGSGFYINSWSSESAGEGDAADFANPFYEMWVSSGSLAASILTKTITGLTANALYEVTAKVRVQYSSKVDGSITMTIGDGKAVDLTTGKKIGDTNRYIKSFIAFGKADNDGNLTITITINESSGISWLAFRDVNYAASIAEAVTISETATEAPAAKYANVTLTRTLSASYWNSFSVPFDAAIPSGWEVKEFASATDNVITFTDATSFEAGKPYLVKPDADAVNPTFNGVIVENTSGETEGTGDYKFAAQIYNKALATDGTIAYLATDGTIKKLTSGGIKGLRAYFIIPASGAPARISFGDETTGIKSIDNKMQANDAIYDMQGRKVTSVKKGIYVVNGKKIIK